MGADEFAPQTCSSTCVRGNKTLRCGLIEGHGAEHWSNETAPPSRWASAPKIEVDINLKGDDAVQAVLNAFAEPDPIAHPPHYTRFPVEVIQITEHLNFCRGNVVKYVCRAGAKEGEDEVTPLRKAHWYLERELDRIDPEWRTR